MRLAEMITDVVAKLLYLLHNYLMGLSLIQWDVIEARSMLVLAVLAWYYISPAVSCLAGLLANKR